MQERKGPDSMVGLSRAVSGVNHSRTGVSLLKKKNSLQVCAWGRSDLLRAHTDVGWRGVVPWAFHCPEFSVIAGRSPERS